jgi:hypothetical protein
MNSDVPQPTSTPAVAQQRLAWFHAALRRRIRRFEARLAGVAAAERLLDAVRRACSSLSPMTRTDDLPSEFRRTLARSNDLGPTSPTERAPVDSATPTSPLIRQDLHEPPAL